MMRLFSALCAIFLALPAVAQTTMKVIPGSVANPITVFNAIDPIMAQTSAPVDASKWKTISGSARVTGNAITGTYKLQGSQDGVAWSDISGATVSATVLVPNPPAFNIPPTSIAYKWARAVWANTTQIVQRIVTTADVNGSLAGKSFLFSGVQDSSFPFGSAPGPNGKQAKYWFRVSGAGTPPTSAPPGYSIIPIDIAANSTSTQVAAAIVSAAGGYAAPLAAPFGAFRKADDGVNFTAASLPGGNYNQTSFLGAYGNGTHVILTSNATPNQATYTSTDGITFALNMGGTIPPDANEITFGAGLFVAVGQAGHIYTSPDGVTWTTRTSGVAVNLNTVVYNGTYFIALGASGTAGCRSDDGGLTWTNPTVVSGNWKALAWNGTRWSALQQNSTTLMHSTDGNAWTSSATAVSGAWAGVAAIPNGAFFAWGSGIWSYSSDGTSYTSIAAVIPYGSNNTGWVVWDATRSRLVWTWSSTVSTSVYYSTDALAWTYASLQPFSGSTVTRSYFAGSTLCAIGWSAVQLVTQSNVFRSNNVITWASGGAGAGMVPAADVDTGFTFTRNAPVGAAVTGTVWGIY